MEPSSDQLHNFLAFVPNYEESIDDLLNSENPEQKIAARIQDLEMKLNAANNMFADYSKAKVDVVRHGRNLKAMKDSQNQPATGEASVGV